MPIPTGQLSRFAKVRLSVAQITIVLITVEQITDVSSVDLVVITVGGALRECRSEGKNILIKVTGETYKKKKK